MKQVRLRELGVIVLFLATVELASIPWVSSGSHSIPSAKDQDRLDEKRAIDSDPARHFFGVYDGHGDRTVDVAGVVRDTVGSAFIEHMRDDIQPLTAIQRALELAEKTVSSPLYEKGGTTAVNAYVDGSKLYISNVGDSRAVIGRRDKNERFYAYQPLPDHALENEKERERLSKIGAKVRTRGCFTHNIYNHSAQDDWVCPQEGEHDLALELYGMRFTRSIGDAWFKKRANEDIGNSNNVILATPQIASIDVTGRDAFVILASDGVWESSIAQPISNDEAVGIVARSLANYSDKARAARMAARELALTAQRRWGGDDIAVVVVVFDWRPYMQRIAEGLAIDSVGTALVGAALRERLLPVHSSSEDTSAVSEDID